MNPVLWVLQVVLAALFAIAGVMKAHPAQGQARPTATLG
jgi:hypothetical protein